MIDRGPRLAPLSTLPARSGALGKRPSRRGLAPCGLPARLTYCGRQPQPTARNVAMTTTAAELLHVELDQATISIEPGGAPVVAHIAIHNLSRIVDRYSVQVGGLDPEWFTVSNSTLSLFPGDTEQIELRIQPPGRRSDLRAGSYPFVVAVRSAGSDSTSTIGGEVAIRGD